MDSLGKLFVEIVQKGFKEARAALQGVKKDLALAGDGTKPINDGTGALSRKVKEAEEGFKKFSATLTSVGHIAERAFLVGTASLTAFVRAADPYGFNKLSGTMAALSVQIGSIFLPLLDRVQHQLEGVLNWFRSLTGAQKTSILHWVEVGGAVLVVASIIPRLASAFGFLSTVLTTVVQPAIVALGGELGVASAGIIPLVGLIVTAAIGLGFFAASFSDAGQEAGAFSAILKPLQDLLAVLWDAFKRLSDAVTPAFETMGVAVGVFSEIIEGSFAAFKPLFDSVVNAVVRFVGACSDAWKDLIVAFLPPFQQIEDTFNRVFTSVNAVLGTFVEIATESFAWVTKATTSMYTACAPLFDALAEVVEVMGNYIANAIDAVEAVFKQFQQSSSDIGDALTEVFTALMEVFQTVFEVIRDVVDTFAAAFTSDGSEWTDIVSFFVSAIKGAAGIIITSVHTITNAIRLLKPVFAEVFGFLNNLIQGAIKSMIFWSTFFAQIARGNIRGAKQAGLDAVANYEKSLKAIQDKRKDARDKLQNPAKKKEDERHAGQDIQKHEFVGFADLFKRANTAAANTPELKAAEERRKLQEKQLEEAKKQTKLMEEEAKKKAAQGGFGR